MKCEVAIHDWFTFDHGDVAESYDERKDDPELTNLWVTDVDLPIEEMREMDEREIIDIILNAIFLSGNWMLPPDAYDYQVWSSKLPDDYKRMSSQFPMWFHEDFMEQLRYDVCLDGWHIVREKSPGDYEWLGQGSSFCPDKFIN